MVSHQNLNTSGLMVINQSKAFEVKPKLKETLVVNWKIVPSGL